MKTKKLYDSIKSDETLWADSTIHGEKGHEVARESIIQRCKAAGWQDVHGGPEDGGMFWRGTNPNTGRVEAIPKEIIEANTKPMKG